MSPLLTCVKRPDCDRWPIPDSISVSRKASFESLRIWVASRSQTWRGEDIREISMSSIDLAAYLPMNLRGLSMVLFARTQCLQTTSFQYSGR